MNIRIANREDIPVIMETYAVAREFMRSTGNPAQWTDGYPAEELVAEGIRGGKHYVCECGSQTAAGVPAADGGIKGELAGTFWFSAGPDPVYAEIYDGAWLDDAPYGVIHRLASNGKFRGVADACFEWCFAQTGNIRVDTHRDNVVMQNILKKNGYVRCGIVHLPSGAERIAFQKVI